ncbi:MAG: DUF2784 domain-containing protein [Planctomycetota bacterium]|nr:MAG: DUF2784 domain-containing protein [Planctomycetota bacterium]
MQTLYRLAADVTVFLHFAYVAFVVLGLFAVLIGYLRGWQWIRHPGFRGVHLTMILIVVFEAWWGITCPLTTLEQSLRVRSGQSSYAGSFLANGVHDLLFMDLPLWAFTVIYTLFGALVMLTFWLVPIRRSLTQPED